MIFLKKRLVLILGASFALFGASCGQNTATEQETNKPARSGKEVYTATCTACHGEDGKKGLANASDLSLSTLEQEELEKIIANGRNTMAGFKSMLSEAEIEAVATYIKTLRSEP